MKYMLSVDNHYGLKLKTMLTGRFYFKPNTNV